MNLLLFEYSGTSSRSSSKENVFSHALLRSLQNRNRPSQPKPNPAQPKKLTSLVDRNDIFFVNLYQSCLVVVITNLVDLAFFCSTFSPVCEMSASDWGTFEILL